MVFSLTCRAHAGLIFRHSFALTKIEGYFHRSGQGINILQETQQFPHKLQEQKSLSKLGIFLEVVIGTKIVKSTSVCVGTVSF